MTADNRTNTQNDTQNDSQQNTNADETKGQNEVELPTPQKENKDITTGGENETQDQGGKNNDLQEDRGQQNTGKTGFQPENNSQESEKRKSDETERKDRESTKPTYQNADNTAQNPDGNANDWAQDKLNEANNQKGNPKQDNARQDNESQGTSVDEKGKPHEKNQAVNKEANVSDSGKEKGSLGDTRRDSITNRPRTETYEKENQSDTWTAINKENRGHTDKEQSRAQQNKNR